jgi:hypothetical protein
MSENFFKSFTERARVRAANVTLPLGIKYVEFVECEDGSLVTVEMPWSQEHIDLRANASG